MIKHLDRELLRQLSFFGLVGVSATLVHYFVALLSHEYLGINLYVANLAGYCTAVLISYFGHGRLTFKRNLHWPVFLRFILVSLATLLFSEGILWGLETHTTLHHSVSLAIVVSTIPILTFILSKLWVFRA